MISKNEIKFIKSLSLQKFRSKNNLFKVEGWRTIKEFLNSNFYKKMNIFSSVLIFLFREFFILATKSMYGLSQSISNQFVN